MARTMPQLQSPPVSCEKAAPTRCECRPTARAPTAPPVPSPPPTLDPETRAPAAPPAPSPPPSPSPGSRQQG
ncbi:unnamed protein product, partial [Closterium sp. NIES-53]